MSEFAGMLMCFALVGFFIWCIGSFMDTSKKVGKKLDKWLDED